jgi:hypothetical protein
MRFRYFEERNTLLKTLQLALDGQNQQYGMNGRGIELEENMMQRKQNIRHMFVDSKVNINQRKLSSTQN